MSDSPTLYVVLAVVFSAFAVMRLLVPDYVDLVQGAVALLLAVGSGLFAWSRRGGPAWADAAAKGAYALGVLLALGDMVAETI